VFLVPAAMRRGWWRWYQGTNRSSARDRRQGWTSSPARPWSLSPCRAGEEVGDDQKEGCVLAPSTCEEKGVPLPLSPFPGGGGCGSPEAWAHRRGAVARSSPPWPPARLPRGRPLVSLVADRSPPWPPARRHRGRGRPCVAAVVAAHAPPHGSPLGAAAMASFPALRHGRPLGAAVAARSPLSIEWIGGGANRGDIG
jgi:hypothetical protein